VGKKTGKPGNLVVEDRGDNSGRAARCRKAMEREERPIKLSYWGVT